MNKTVQAVILSKNLSLQSTFLYDPLSYLTSPGGPRGKEPTCKWSRQKRGGWVRSVGGEDALEEAMANHSSILAWRIPMDRGSWWATVQGVIKSWTQLSD